MRKYNPENERIKRKYFGYLKEAKRQSEVTVDDAAKALSRFEERNRYRDFKVFHIEQAIAFKRHLAEQTAQRSGQKLSKATLHATLTQLKSFFFWLAGQPGYKARLQYSDADYFNLSEKDKRIATAQRERKAPKLEQVKHVIGVMPAGSEIERRNRAGGFHATDRSAGLSDCLHETEACGPEGRLRLPGRTGSEYKIQQNLHHLFLSCGRRGPADCCRLGAVSAGREALE